MSRQKLSGAALPALVAAMPLVVEALVTLSTRAGIWFSGDQALIDIEARNSLLGRNLLGVYDRYGWHHLGPIWLLLLGVFRWLGGGSPVAVVVGSYTLQAIAAASIVVVACRLRPGLTGWWAALVVLGYEWALGPDRLGILWAPYAVALPAALLVLLVADVAVSRRPLAPTIAMAVCASFLCQTDISTIVLVVGLVAAAPLLRLAVRALLASRSNGLQWPARADAADATSPVVSRKGRGLAVLAGVLGVLWLPPIIQQLTNNPGNFSQVFRFLSTHTGHHSWATAFKAADTLMGSFPFRVDEAPEGADALPRWLVSHAVWEHPWYLVYLVSVAIVGAFAFRYANRAALGLAASTFVAMLGALVSIFLVHGPLFPYLVVWAGALAVPAWVAVWLVLEPWATTQVGHFVRRHWARFAPAASTYGTRLVVPLASVATAAAVTWALASSPVPMAENSTVAHEVWDTVAPVVLAPGVRTVYLKVYPDDMPDTAAIADQVVRHGRQVELDRAALYYLDPSFAPRSASQLTIIVCCGRGDPGDPPAGMTLRGIVKGQEIYTSRRL